MKKLNRTIIKSAAGTKIYSRGLSIYENHFIKVNKRGNTYTAQVKGTRLYDVKIETKKNGDFDGDCSCPYDWDWCCKHMVAVALIAIEMQEDEAFDDGIEDAKIESQTPFKAPTKIFVTDKKTKPTVRVTTTEFKPKVVPVHDFYDGVFLKSTKQEQVDFIRSIFNKHPELREEFTDFLLNNAMR